MKKLNKREKTFWEELREIIKSPEYEKGAKNMKKMYEEEYYIDFGGDTIVFAYGLNNKQNLAKPVRVSSKKKGVK